MLPGSWTQKTERVQINKSIVGCTLLRPLHKAEADNWMCLLRCWFRERLQNYTSLDFPQPVFPDLKACHEAENASQPCALGVLRGSGSSEPVAKWKLTKKGPACGLIWQAFSVSLRYNINSCFLFEIFWWFLTPWKCIQVPKAARLKFWHGCKMSDPSEHDWWMQTEAGTTFQTSRDRANGTGPTRSQQVEGKQVMGTAAVGKWATLGDSAFLCEVSSLAILKQLTIHSTQHHTKTIPNRSLREYHFHPVKIVMAVWRF